METSTLEMVAVDIANLILYDKLDGCICFNESLAERIVAVLGTYFDVHKEIDQSERSYRIWVERDAHSEW